MKETKAGVGPESNAVCRLPADTDDAVTQRYLHRGVLVLLYIT